MLYNVCYYQFFGTWLHLSIKPPELFEMFKKHQTVTLKIPQLVSKTLYRVEISIIGPCKVSNRTLGTIKIFEDPIVTKVTLL